MSGCNAILAACPLYVACVDVRAANAALDAAREDGRNDSAQAEACNDADAALHALLNATELGPDAPAEILCAIENAVKAAWDDGYGDGLDDGMAK